jgi:hypothetical protein
MRRRHGFVRVSSFSVFAFSGFLPQINSQHTQNLAKPSLNRLKIFTGCAATIGVLRMLKSRPGRVDNRLKPQVSSAI